MNTSLMLCNCYQLDSNYNHTVDFKSRESQLNWFTIRSMYTLTNNMYQRKSENVIRVDKPLNSLNNVNYVVANNLDDGTRYFYFVINKEYVNDYTTTLVLQLDLIQTYLFDINFTTCLIDRQHVKRWSVASNGDKKPNYQYEQEDEGLELGEYVIKKRTSIYDYTNKGSHIIVSSEPLGVNDNSNSIPNTTSKKYLNGYMDKNGLRMIKSLEGFASTPYNIGDGTNTIGYGVTEVYSTSAYNSLLPSCTEQQASEVLGDKVYFSYSSALKSQLDSDGYNWGYMTQDLFNAMVSFAWNSGAYAMRTNYNELWQLILNGENKNNPNNLSSVWSTTNIMVGSEFEQGLRTRREREGLIAIGQYNYSNFIISNVTEGGTITDNEGYGYIPIEYM